MGAFASIRQTFTSRIISPGVRMLMIFIICIAILYNRGWADDADPLLVDINDVVVTGSRIPVTLSSAGQSMTVISREEIKNFPVDNIPDLLETVCGVDVRQRGGFGIQADVSIRGGSFEQTLILVDGINVSDAQTGHHNMNLPVNIVDIERIEILKGPGAKVYGHNAMTGVINIITRDADQNRVGGAVHYGRYDYVRLEGNLESKIAGISNRISISKRASSGYIKNEETDFDTYSLTYKGTLRKDAHSFHLGLGYMENDFGAYKFYSDAFPDQREKTETLLAYGSGDIHLSKTTIASKIFWRQNKDMFDIEIGGNWFQNKHKTNSYGAQFNLRIDSVPGETAIGGEVAIEDIKSSNLGDHDRSRYGLFLEQRVSLHRKITMGAGVSAMRYSDWGWEYWPGADMNIELAKGVNCFASAARSFRVPTYTELYYNTAANQGNPDLKPERAWTYEIGLRRMKSGFGVTVGLFYRDAEDSIDWTREPGDAIWKVRNIAENKTRGFELGTDLYPGLLFDRLYRTTFHLSYTYLDSDRDAGEYESRYVLDHLRHQVKGSVSINWSDRLIQTITARYEKRMNEDSHVVADTRLTYTARKCELFLDITNLFDENYVDSGFAPAPARWIVAGIRVNRDL